jgi:hypothetical protein
MDGETLRQWEDGDQTTDNEGHYLLSEDLERLRGALCHFRPSVRTVIEVLQLHDAPTAEIVYLAGASILAIKYRLLRTRTVLRIALDRKAIEIWIAKLAFVISHVLNRLVYLMQYSINGNLAARAHSGLMAAPFL